VQRATWYGGAGGPRSATHCPGESTLRHLKPLEIPVGHTTHQAVAVIEPGGNDSLGEHLGSVEVQQRSNVSHCTGVVVASVNHIKDMTVHRQRTIKLDTKQLDGTPATSIPDDTSTFCHFACVPHNIASALVGFSSIAFSRNHHSTSSTHADGATRKWKTRERQKCRSGKRWSGNHVTRIQGWKTREKQVWKAKIHLTETFLSKC